MKRSEINHYIQEARSFFAANQFNLPPYADWTPEEWRQRGAEADDIRASRLGWDVTDFNSGRFESLGLTLLTLRNGSLAGGENSKVYAEKIMFVLQNQITPFHYHAHKTEDIINRGGKGTGRLLVQVYNSTKDGGFAQSPVSVICDGVRREVEAGGTVLLGSGESITLTPYLYHQFYAVDGHGMIGEVSSFNDDDTDNYFKDPLPDIPKLWKMNRPFVYFARNIQRCKRRLGRETIEARDICSLPIVSATNHAPDGEEIKRQSLAVADPARVRVRAIQKCLPPTLLIPQQNLVDPADPLKTAALTVEPL